MSCGRIAEVRVISAPHVLPPLNQASLSRIPRHYSMRLGKERLDYSREAGTGTPLFRLILFRPQSPVSEQATLAILEVHERYRQPDPIRDHAKSTRVTQDTGNK